MPWPSSPPAALPEVEELPLPATRLSDEVLALLHASFETPLRCADLRLKPQKPQTVGPSATHILTHRPMHPAPSCHHLDTAPTGEKRARSATLTSRTCGSLRSRCSRCLLTLALTLKLTLTLILILTVALALLGLLQANADPNPGPKP